jgi:hypothetical protein
MGDHENGKERNRSRGKGKIHGRKAIEERR